MTTFETTFGATFEITFKAFVGQLGGGEHKDLGQAELGHWNQCHELLKTRDRAS